MSFLIGLAAFILISALIMAPRFVGMAIILGAILSAMVMLSMTFTFWVSVVPLLLVIMAFQTFAHIPEGDDRIVDDSNREQQNSLGYY